MPQNNENQNSNTVADQLMLSSIILCIIFTVAFVIGVTVIYTVKKINNKNNLCAISLTSLFVLLLIFSSSYWWAFAQNFQPKAVNAQKTKDCDEYSEWLLYNCPTVEWAMISAGLVSAYTLIILSVAGLFKYRPTENKVLFPACIITSIIWLFTFLISHKFNQCQLKRYVNKHCSNTSTPV
jgi:high-affinity Fe2+/Pb2+ permease